MFLYLLTCTLRFSKGKGKFQVVKKEQATPASRFRRPLSESPFEAAGFGFKIIFYFTNKQYVIQARNTENF